MQIKPARGYVLIEPVEADEISAGGVLLPERAKDMPQKGKVLAIGKLPLDVWKVGLEQNKVPYSNEYLEVEKGDTVIFKKFVDNKIKEEGKELLLVKFEDILATYG